MRRTTSNGKRFQHYNNFIDTLSTIPTFAAYADYNYLIELRAKGEAEFLTQLDKGEGFKIINIMDDIRLNLLNEEQRRAVTDIPHALLLPKVNTRSITSRYDSSGITQTSTGRFSNGSIATVDHHFQIDQSPDIIVKEQLLVDYEIPEDIFVGNFTGELTALPEGERPECTITSTDTFKAGLDNPHIKKLYMSLLFRRAESSVDHYVLFALDFTNDTAPTISLYNSLPYVSITEELFHKECLYQAMRDIIEANPETSPRALATLEAIDQNIEDRRSMANGIQTLERDNIIKPCYEQPGENDCQTSVAILMKDLVLTHPPRITARYNRFTGLASNVLMPIDKQREVVETRLNCLQMSGARINRLIDMLTDKVPQNNFDDYKQHKALPTNIGALAEINIPRLQQYLKGNASILSTLDNSHKYALLSAIDMMLEHHPDSQNSTVYKYFNRPEDINPDLLFSELMMTYLGGIIISPESQQNIASPKSTVASTIQAFNNIGDIKQELPYLITYGTTKTIWKFIQNFNATANSVFLDQDLDSLPHLLASLNELITHKAIAVDALKYHRGFIHDSTMHFEQKIADLDQQYSSIKLLSFTSPVNLLQSITAINIHHMGKDDMLSFIKRFNQTDDSVLTNMSAKTQSEVNAKLKPLLGIINRMNESLRSSPDIQNFLTKYSLLSQLPITQSRGSLSGSSEQRSKASPEDNIITLYSLMQKSQSLKQGLMRLELPFSDSKPQANGKAKISARYIGLDGENNIQVTNEKGKVDTNALHLSEIMTHVANILDLYRAIPCQKTTRCYDYIIDTETIPEGVIVTKLFEHSTSEVALSALQPTPVELLSKKLTANNCGLQNQEQSVHSFASQYQQSANGTSKNI